VRNFLNRVRQLSQRHPALAITVVLVGASATWLVASSFAAPHAVIVSKPHQIHVWLSPSGNDSTCARNNPSRPCATFDRAYELAHGGDTVAVAAGTYPMTTPTEDATKITPSNQGKNGAVAFICEGNGDVHFDAPNFVFAPGLSDVSVTGGCFRFNDVNFGYGGYPQRTRDIALHNVHMTSVECAGCADVTIDGSEIGPMIACYAASTGGVPASAMCDPDSVADGQAYWATHGGSNTAGSYLAFFHDGDAGNVQDIVLSHDRFHDINTKYSSQLHDECLFLWNFDGVTLDGNTFKRCGIFDVFIPAENGSDNLTIQNNTFGPPVQTLDNGGQNGIELARDWRDVVVQSNSGTVVRNWLIRFNKFSHGLSLDNGEVGQQFVDVRVLGNVLGNNTYCPPGTSFIYNVFVGGGCGSHPLSVARFPYIDYSAGDFRLIPNSRTARFLKVARGKIQGR
jgi:hypothetical protein